MVYRIQGDFNENNFEKIINNLQKYYRILFRYGNLYIAPYEYSQVEEAEKTKIKTFKPAKNFYISQITEENLSREEFFVIDWCRDALVELDRQRYEIENQLKLQKVNEALDKMEEILQNQNIKESEVTDK